MKALLSTAYWPNLHYFFYLVNSESVAIEQHEHYQKQSYRNRSRILSANGPLDLSIPVKKTAPKILTKDLEICYRENWQIRHWRAITSAYKSSPYFDFFEDEIRFFYEQRFETLLDFNLQQLNTLFKILRLNQTIVLTRTFETQVDPGQTDLRNLIHPKVDFTTDTLVTSTLLKAYYQTFGDKFDFLPNLSILDLLFNTGLESKTYLALK